MASIDTNDQSQKQKRQGRQALFEFPRGTSTNDLSRATNICGVVTHVATKVVVVASAAAAAAMVVVRAAVVAAATGMAVMMVARQRWL